MTRKLNFPRLSAKVLSALFVLVAFAATASTAYAAGSTTLVISQIYGAGGNSGATWQNDYVEIFNRSTSAVSLNGLSVQYASATTTTNASGVIPLPNVSMPAGSYYLIQMAGATTNGIADPVTPDLNNATTQGVNMSGTGGRVFIFNGTTAVAGSALCGGTGVIDFVGYGTTPVCAEGSPTSNADAAPAPSTTNFDLRAGAGCTDTDVNSADFTAPVLGSPSPHNSSSAVNLCSSGSATIPSGAGSASPASVPQGSSTVLSVLVTPGTNPTSTGVAVSVNLTAFGGSATQAMTLSGTANTYTYTLNVSGSQAVNAADTVNATITDTQADSVPVVPIVFAVTSASSTTTAVPTASPLAPTPNQSTTLATVVTGSSTPTGSVTFKDGSTTLGSGTLSTASSTTATASYTVSGGFSSGAHSITAVYVPTGIYTTSTSTALSLNVAATTFGSGVVISQMYGAGGNSGATINADYLELFNDSASAQTLTGWSIQYASAAGASVTAGSNVWALPTITIPAGGYYLVGGATGSQGVAPTLAFDTVPLDTATTPIGFGFAASAGKVYLVNSTTALSSTATPLPSSVIDAITYGTGLTNAQGTAAPAPGATTLDVRTNPCIVTHDGSDFTATTITVGTAHNSTSPVNLCAALPAAASNPLAIPSTVKIGSNTLLTVTVTPGFNPVSTGIAVKANLTAFGGSATQAFNDAGTGGDAVAGDGIYSYTLAVPGSQGQISYNINVTVTDTQGDTIPAQVISLSVAALSSTSTALTVTPTPTIPNQSTVLTATISPGSGPTGTVIFRDAGTQIGTTANVNGSGVATITLASGLSPGIHSLSAAYSGDANYATSTGTLSLAIGTPVVPDFTLGLANAQVITSGTAPTATVGTYITAVGGFSSVITLSCSGLPSNVNCFFTPSTVTPNAGSTGPFVSSVLTFTAESSANIKPHFYGKAGGGLAVAFTLLAAPFAFRKRRSALRLMALLVVLLAGMQALTGCGNGLAAGTTTVTVTATAASGQTHTGTIVVVTE